MLRTEKKIIFFPNKFPTLMSSNVQQTVFTVKTLWVSQSSRSWRLVQDPQLVQLVPGPSSLVPNFKRNQFICVFRFLTYETNDFSSCSSSVKPAAGEQSLPRMPFLMQPSAFMYLGLAPAPHGWEIISTWSVQFPTQGHICTQWDLNPPLLSGGGQTLCPLYTDLQCNFWCFFFF